MSEEVVRDLLRQPPRRRLPGLTAGQQDIWGIVKPHEYEASAGQTLEQAREFAISSFQCACSFDGVEVPPREVIEAAMNELRPRERR